MEEIRAVLLQMAIYCGVPATLDATKIARGVLCDMGVLAERS
jgi:4-carboxymuconolactone decarboxylase